MAVEWHIIDYQRTAARKAAKARQWLFKALAAPGDRVAQFWREDAIQYQRDAAVYSRIARSKMGVEE